MSTLPTPLKRHGTLYRFLSTTQAAYKSSYLKGSVGELDISHVSVILLNSFEDM